jgi:hypothetical protein
MEKAWVVSLRRQCREAKVRFFFKQWGGFPKGVLGRELNGKTYDDSPPRLSTPMPPQVERATAVAQAEGLASAWSAAPLVPLRRRRAAVA